MEENKTFNMTEHLNGVVIKLEELKNHSEVLNQSLLQLIEEVLEMTSSSPKINSLINNNEYRQALRKPLSELKPVCEDDKAKIPEAFDMAIKVLTLCQGAIPMAKSEGVEII
jgi:hypothetical protein